MGYALKLTSEVWAVLPTLSVEAQEDLWGLFDNLAATAGPTGATGGREVEMHVFVWVDEPERVRLLFPLVIDHRTRSALVPRLRWLTAA